MLQTYAITGAFSAVLTGTSSSLPDNRRAGVANRPKSMEVMLTGSSSARGAVVYISDNCMAEYGVPQTNLPNVTEITSFLNGKSQRRKREIESVKPKCYKWDDILSPAISYITPFPRLV